MGVDDHPTSPDDADLEPDDDWPARCEITDPAAIALLTDLRAFRVLAPFLRATHTLTTAARAADRPASSMAHWIPRFVDNGLLVRRGEVRRAGAPMPRYRAPARKLVVPFELIPFDARVRLLDEGRMTVLRRFLDGVDEALAATRSFGLGFEAYGEGATGSGVKMELEETATQRSRRTFTDGWRTLELTEEDAGELGRAIEDLFERHEGRRGPKTFVCHAGIAPDPVFRWRSATDRRS